MDEPKNSLRRLNKNLTRENKNALKKESRSYRSIASDMKKKKLSKFIGHRSSLGLFLQSIDRLPSGGNLED